MNEESCVKVKEAVQQLLLDDEFFILPMTKLCDEEI